MTPIRATESYVEIEDRDPALDPCLAALGRVATFLLLIPTQDFASMLAGQLSRAEGRGYDRAAGDWLAVHAHCRKTARDAGGAAWTMSHTIRLVDEIVVQRVRRGTPAAPSPA